VPDLSEVLFNITADGCAFYSIPYPTQPLFLIIFHFIYHLLIYSSKTALFL